VKPRLCIITHRTPTGDLDLEGKAQAIDKIMDKNDLTEHGFRIEDLTWLKKKDK
jgi:hypothetical protein